MKYRMEEALCIRFTRIRVFLFYAIIGYKQIGKAWKSLEAEIKDAQREE